MGLLLSLKEDQIAITRDETINSDQGRLSLTSQQNSASDQVAQTANPYDSSYNIYSNGPRLLVIDKPIIVHKRPDNQATNTRLAIMGNYGCLSLTS